jgi:8-oxo-dGTP pyrophosphatase MutT (NUDIX family)
MSDERVRRPSDLAALLERYQARTAVEAEDVTRLADMMRAGHDPWPRSSPLHATASALIVHPDSGRVLLRWHQRQQAWLQVGGHADAGETDALAIALREAQEETGLTDVTPWPTDDLRHVVIVKVSAGKGEPAHEHADLRFVLATSDPDAIVPEDADAPLRWLSLGDAMAATAEDNLCETLDRVQVLLAAHVPGQGSARRG